MKGVVFIGIVVLLLIRTVPGFGEDSLLLETWTQSYFTPAQLDAFIQAHRGRYTEEYFRCSQEAQRLIREESRIRDRQCDFAPDTGVRGRCRRENHFRGIDTHLAELEQAIRTQTPWLDVESGRAAMAASRAAAELEKSCSPPACEITKRKKNELLRDLRPYLQCPPRPDRPLEVDPSFRTFQLPSDPGG